MREIQKLQSTGNKFAFLFSLIELGTMTGAVLRLPGIERRDKAIKFATLNVVPNPSCP